MLGVEEIAADQVRDAVAGGLAQGVDELVLV
jgi:hypothetical protein